MVDTDTPRLPSYVHPSISLAGNLLKLNLYVNLDIELFFFSNTTTETFAVSV